MSAQGSDPSPQPARPALQGPSHAWIPWALAGLAAAGAWLWGAPGERVLSAGLFTLLAAFGAFLAWREPPVGTEGRLLAWAALLLVPLVAAAALGAPRVAPGLLALAVGAAQPPIVRRALGGAPGAVWGRGGFLLALLVALLARPPRVEDATWVALGAVLVLQSSWLVLLLRARREERDPARPFRFACPRCGLIRSRAPGKGPCADCGLFLLLDRAPSGVPPEPPHPTPAKPIWLLCPTCRLRLFAPRGRCTCPQCRTELWAEWNEHVIGGAVR